MNNLFLLFLSKNFLALNLKIRGNMYPKVKVRVQREEDDDDQYGYEKSSLESLKAFEWLSLHHSSSSDESPVSVVRVPRAYAPKSPAPGFLSSKDTKEKKAVVEGNWKSARPASAPRPRAVLSSPDNDGLIGSKTLARGKQFSGLKNRPASQNRHSQCKNFLKSSNFEGGFTFTAQGYHKESAEPNNSLRTKGRTAVHRKKINHQSP
ncbi:Unknown protein [Striga hermonthica]|uniref:Uncharacterized protein n=1 Tax=Striga hermonthica TaxID=68872 RepID=A0A9N7N0T2_STRHE|nr:Unknown protein [Striga hermonthica]